MSLKGRSVAGVPQGKECKVCLKVRSIAGSLIKAHGIPAHCLTVPPCCWIAVRIDLLVCFAVTSWTSWYEEVNVR